MTLEGLRTIRAYGQEALHQRRFVSLSTAARRASIRSPACPRRCTADGDRLPRDPLRHRHRRQPLARRVRHHAGSHRAAVSPAAPYAGDRIQPAVPGTDRAAAALRAVDDAAAGRGDGQHTRAAAAGAAQGHPLRSRELSYPGDGKPALDAVSFEIPRARRRHSSVPAALARPPSSICCWDCIAPRQERSGSMTCRWSRYAARIGCNASQSPARTWSSSKER